MKYAYSVKTETVNEEKPHVAYFGGWTAANAAYQEAVENQDDDLICVTLSSSMKRNLQQHWGPAAPQNKLDGGPGETEADTTASDTRTPVYPGSL